MNKHDLSNWKGRFRRLVQRIKYGEYDFEILVVIALSMYIALVTLKSAL